MASAARRAGPDWTLVAPDLFRRILLVARGDLKPISLHNKLTGHPSGKAWAQWWQLAARVSSTCKALHTALLGPDAGALWSRWTCLQGHGDFPINGLRWEQMPGLYQMLLRQAHHARSALVVGDHWRTPRLYDTELKDAELQPVIASLVSLQELHLRSYRAGQADAWILPALPCSPHTLICCGLLPFQHCDRLHGLQRLSLKVNYLPETHLRHLASQLPHLQCMELVLVTWTEDPANMRSFHLLSLVQVDRLTLRLSFNKEPLQMVDRLKQLAHVQLFVLQLSYCQRHLMPEQLRLLQNCQVRERVVLQLLNGKSEQLHSLPSGAAVAYEPYSRAPI